MWNSVSRLTTRPAVLVAVSVVGCGMLWLACKQVKSTIDVLVHLQVLSSSQMNKLSDKPRYCLFGILTLAYVWLDLVLLKMLLDIARLLARCCNKLMRAKRVSGLNHGEDSKQKAKEPLRKNPMRACKIVHKRSRLDN